MKKILSFILALILSLSCLAITGVGAEETEFTPSEEPIIYFEVPEDWGSYKRVFCHVFDWIERKNLMNWQSKISRCEKVKGTDNLYSYDLSVLSSFDEAKDYIVYFSVDTGIQTYGTVFSAKCYGDTLYSDGTKILEPANFEWIVTVAYWKNQDKSVYGPLMCISPLGDVVGYSLPKPITTEDLMADFFSYRTIYTNSFLTVKDHTDMSDQEIVDSIGHQLNLSKTTVARLESEANVLVFWNKENSTLPIILGDANDDEHVNINDATAIQKHIAGFDAYINEECADSDTNLSVNVKDATAIQKHIAGIETGTPIGELYRNDYTYPCK